MNDNNNCNCKTTISPIEIEIVNPNVPSHNLQTKIVTPTKETQVVTPDEGYYGLREVVVSPPVIDGEEIINKVNEISETLSESYIGGDAKASEILEGKTAYVKGKKVQGTIEKYSGTNKIEVQKDEVGTYTLSTANKYVENDINVEIVETKKTPYDYFKNILDNDTEDYPYKTMIVYPGEYEKKTSFSSTYRYKINGEIVQDTSVDWSTCESIEVYDSVYNKNTKFKYIIFYYTSGPWSFPYQLVYYLNYCILSENNLEAVFPYDAGASYFFRKTNMTRYSVYTFYRYNYNTIEDENVVVKVVGGIGTEFFYNTTIRNTLFIDNDSYKKNEPFSFNNTRAKRIEFKNKQVIKAFEIRYAENEYGYYNDLINFNLLNYSPFNYSPDGACNYVNLRFFNINKDIVIGYDTNIGLNLTYDSIIHTIKELIMTDSLKKMTIGTYNKVKIANTYVKLVDVADISQEMIDEDEYILRKKPFIICESTDEGAMTLDEYVALKNWQIA